MSPARGKADWCVVEGFFLKNSQSNGGPTFPGGPANMDGIRVMSHGSIFREIHVLGFPRDGIILYASYPPTFTPQVNGNNTQFRDLVLSNNGRNGITLIGDDSNVCLGINIDASGNWDTGIYDHSFLGCTWVGCHTSANRRLNYDCDRISSPTFSSFFGCYAEQDAPSIFKGNIAVVGGDLAYIHNDSSFWGFAPASAGPSSLSVRNRYSSVRGYPGQGAGYGIFIAQNDYYQPNNGYYYKALSSGRTYGTYHPGGELPPVWPTVVGQTVSEYEGLVWRCEGTYTQPVEVFHTIGGGTSEGWSLGWQKPSGATPPYWMAKKSAYTGVTERWLVGLAGGVQTFGYWLTGYESGPAPGQIMLSDVWHGSYGDERRIAQVVQDTPFTGRAGYFNWYRPGDLILNGAQSGSPYQRSGGPGWTVKIACGRAALATTWSANTHYAIGTLIKPTVANGYVYRLAGYESGAPDNSFSRISGASEPSWGTSVGYNTVDNHLTWSCLLDLDVPANQWALEPLQSSGIVSVNCTAGGTITLNDYQMNNDRIKLTGSPVASFIVVAQFGVNGWTRVFWNNTGYPATIKASVGDTGVVVPGSKAYQIISDGTNAIRIE